MSFLNGKHDEIIKSIDKEIDEKVNKLEFESAAVLRDRKISIQNLMERQNISNLSENSIDAIGMYRENEISCVQVFSIRQGKIIGRVNHILKETGDLEDKNIIEEFIKQYYSSIEELPNKIMVRCELDDIELIRKMVK